MAWNEPGGGGQDPWRTPRNSGGTPPKVEQWLKDLSGKLGGQGNNSGGNASGSEGGSGMPSATQASDTARRVAKLSLPSRTRVAS